MLIRSYHDERSNNMTAVFYSTAPRRYQGLIIVVCTRVVIVQAPLIVQCPLSSTSCSSTATSNLTSTNRGIEASHLLDLLTCPTEHPYSYFCKRSGIGVQSCM